MLPQTHTMLATCLIVLHDPLIGMDLSTTVADARPDLKVLWVRTPDEALQLLAADARIATAFIDVAPQAFATTALFARLAAAGAALVFLGPDPVAESVLQMSNRIRVLTYPFAMKDVLGMIADLSMK